MSCNNLLFKVSTWKSTNIAIQPKLPLEMTTSSCLHRCGEKLLRGIYCSLPLGVHATTGLQTNQFSPKGTKSQPITVYGVKPQQITA